MAPVRTVAVRALALFVVPIALVLSVDACGATEGAGVSGADPGDASLRGDATADASSSAPGCSRGSECPSAVPIEAATVERLVYEEGTFAQGGGCDGIGSDTFDRLSFDLSAGIVHKERCVEPFNADAGRLDETATIDVGVLRAALAGVTVIPVAEWNDGGSEGADGKRHTLFLERSGEVVDIVSFEHIGSPGPKLDLIAVEGFPELRRTLYELAGLPPRH